MLNEALRLVRIYHDKNQTEMAEILGISKSYLSEIEKGGKNVTLSILEKYSQSLNVPISSLMLFSENLEENSSGKIKTFVASSALKFLNLMSKASPNGRHEDD